ncbi:MAG: DUF2497 domain-containing protein, partial [Brevundimonas sp.]
ILASIRRIISEDEAPAETAPAAAAPEPEQSPALMDETPSVQTAQAPEEDVLELTDRFSPATETIGDLDVSPAEPEPAPEPFPEEPSQSYFAPEEPVTATPEHPSIPTPSSSYDSLVGDGPAASAASAFAGLAASFRKPEPVETASGGVGPTIDDLARQLLRPLLKEWLDANLPGIVEAAVKKEVERIARNAG